MNASLRSSEMTEIVVRLNRARHPERSETADHQRPAPQAVGNAEQRSAFIPDSTRRYCNLSVGFLVLSLLGMTGEILAASPPSPSLEFRFIGNMAFAITDGRTTVFTDFPYQSGAFGYMKYEMSAVPKASGALCLITHGHLDHFDPSLFRKMDAVLIAPPSVQSKVETQRTIPFAPKMSYRNVRVEAFRTPHGEIEHYSYLVSWHGRRLYFTGDTDSTEQLLAMRDLDVAFVSPWLLEAVARQKGRINARRVVVYHHRAGETVAPLQGRRVPKQGEVFVVAAPSLE